MAGEIVPLAHPYMDGPSAAESAFTASAAPSGILVPSLLEGKLSMAPALTTPTVADVESLSARLDFCAWASSTQKSDRSNTQGTCYLSAERGLFVVSDGMGGTRGGELAGQLATRVLSEMLGPLPKRMGPDRQVVEAVRQALCRANEAVADLGRQSWDTHGAGAAVVLALYRNGRLFVEGIGDSRAYLARGGELLQLTVDKTWAQLLVELGEISAAQARTHPKRNCLLEFLGMRDFPADREIEAVELSNGDRLLLCNDGLTNVVEDDELLQILEDAERPQAAADSLIEQARGNGAKDPITALVAFCGD